MAKASSINAALAKAAAVSLGVREDNKLQAAKLLVSAPLAMAALGAMLRGATGLRDMFTAQTLPTPSLLGKMQTVPLPRLHRPGTAEQEKDQPKLAAEKTAEPPPSAPPPATPGAGFDITTIPNWIAKRLIYEPFLQTKPGQVRSPANALAVGDGAHNTMGVPLAWAAFPAALAGGYAGFKGMDAFLDKRRKQQKQTEIEQVKQQYMDALRGKYASTAELGDDFDAAADVELEKIANLDAPAPPAALERALPIPRLDHFAGQYAGFNLAAALAAAMAGGYLGYNHANKNSRRKLMEEALRRRAASQNDPPQPIYADVM